jgi:hypothetical protein
MRSLLLSGRLLQSRGAVIPGQDVQNEVTYFQLLGDGKAFLQFVFAFLLSLGYCFGIWPRLLPQAAPPGLRQKA